MFKLRIHLIYFIIVWISSINYTNAKEIQDNSIFFSKDMNSSMVDFNKKVFQPITAISKIWYETFDAHRRFIVQFLTSSALSNGNFMQNIPVFDRNGKNVEISDWDTADCSITKFMLLQDKQNKSLYLLTSHRQNEFPNPNMNHQNNLLQNIF